jgi:hypothetical protein
MLPRIHIGFIVIVEEFTDENAASTVEYLFAFGRCVLAVSLDVLIVLFTLLDVFGAKHVTV